MGYDNYGGTEIAEQQGQDIYAGGVNGNSDLGHNEQISATATAAASAAALAAAAAATSASADFQPSLNRLLSSIDYDLCFKHPLEHTWTLWHWQNDRAKAWSEMLSDVTSFNTVEDFFSVYYFIKPPSDLKIFNDYMVFKHGIRPMWEDDSNKEGGRWVMFLERDSKELVDKLWHDLLLCTIGECFEYSEQICGAVINVRNKGSKISLWTKDARNEQAIQAIGQKMKQLLQLNEVELQYQIHRDAMVQAGPNVNAIYKM
ncbi:eukaryotic translation initiation factor 4E1 [Drosophila sulfurigaster albostrigata]|uniref:eukaryotic translation initiation factor 4E1 n=1 Tax=Drosophila sulfurigaster albostrigata TaxID=89887 RepID=UPI002D21D5F5|nr:eukaryotic translation initiation factor 4E1 [Drosophila sulfurigaster albostrigata]